MEEAASTKNFLFEQTNSQKSSKHFALRPLQTPLSCTASTTTPGGTCTRHARGTTVHQELRKQADELKPAGLQEVTDKTAGRITAACGR